MKYRLVTVLLAETRGSAIVSKTIELPFHPTADTEFTYHLWNDDKTPLVTATIKDDGNSAFVDELELRFTDKIIPGTDVESIVALYLDRGWSRT